MWETLKVNQFIQLLDIESSKNLNIIEKQQMSLAVLENKDIETYDTMKYSDMVKLYADKSNFLINIPETKYVDYIEVKGKRYKFNFELNEITAGQYIDILAMHGNMMEINKIAACFFLPMKGKKYYAYGEIPHDVVAEEMLEARFIDVYSCMLFFCKSLQELTKDMLTYSNLTEKTKETIIRLCLGGDGFIQQSK